MKLSLVILAAGLGSRFGGMKQLHQVGPNGECILDYSIFDAIQAGFDEIVFVVSKENQALVQDHVKAWSKRVQLTFVQQRVDDLPTRKELAARRQKPWGTGQALYALRNAVNNNFAVINADDFYGSESFHVLAKNLSNTNLSKNKHFMVAYLLRNTLSDFGRVSRGVCTLDDGNLKTIEEHTNIRKESDGRIIGENSQTTEVTLYDKDPVSMNFWGFQSSIFNEVEMLFEGFLENLQHPEKQEFYLPSIIGHGVSSNKFEIGVERSKDKWMGLTYKEDVKLVSAAFKSQDCGLPVKVLT